MDLLPKLQGPITEKLRATGGPGATGCRPLICLVSINPPVSKWWLFTISGVTRVIIIVPVFQPGVCASVIEARNWVQVWSWNWLGVSSAHSPLFWWIDVNTPLIQQKHKPSDSSLRSPPAASGWRLVLLCGVRPSRRSPSPSATRGRHQERRSPWRRAASRRLGWQITADCLCFPGVSAHLSAGEEEEEANSLLKS